jgi:hypothetical protein
MGKVLESAFGFVSRNYKNANIFKSGFWGCFYKKNLQKLSFWRSIVLGWYFVFELGNLKPW